MVKSSTCEKQPNFKSQLPVGVSILVSFNLGFTSEAIIFFFFLNLTTARDAIHMAGLAQLAVLFAFLAPQLRLLWKMTVSLGTPPSGFYVC